MLDKSEWEERLKEKIFPLIRGEQMNLRMREMLPLYKTYH